MRKLLLLMLIGVFALTGCEGPMGPQGPQGEPGGLYTIVEYFEVKNWERVYNTNNPNEVYYQCIVEPSTALYEPKTWDYIYENGTINVTFFSYIYAANGAEIEIQTPLPYVLNYTDNEGNIAVETYYFDYDSGSISFYVALSGSNQTNIPPVMNFKVTMNY